MTGSGDAMAFTAQTDRQTDRRTDGHCMPPFVSSLWLHVASQPIDKPRRCRCFWFAVSQLANMTTFKTFTFTPDKQLNILIHERLPIRYHVQLAKFHIYTRHDKYPIFVTGGGGRKPRERAKGTRGTFPRYILHVMHGEVDRRDNISDRLLYNIPDFIEAVRCICQKIRYFIRITTNALTFTVFKYPLHKCSEIITIRPYATPKVTIQRPYAPTCQNCPRWSIKFLTLLFGPKSC